MEVEHARLRLSSGFLPTDSDIQEIRGELASLLVKHLHCTTWYPKFSIYMATFMSLPTELRLQIYRELFISKPQKSRTGERVSGPISCYKNCTFHTAILGVSREITREAVSIFYGVNAWNLHVYLIFKGDKIHGSDKACALRSFACTELFSHIRTCILDVRIFRGESKKKNVFFSGADALRANIKTVRKILSRADLREIDLSWRNYCDYDLTEPRRRALEPLDQLPVTYKLSIREVENTTESSNKDLTSWPNVLTGSKNSLDAPRNPLVSRIKINAMILQIPPRVMVTTHTQNFSHSMLHPAPEKDVNEDPTRCYTLHISI